MTAPSTNLYFNLLVIHCSNMSIIQNFMTSQIADEKIIIEWRYLVPHINTSCIWEKDLNLLSLTPFDESQYPW